MAKQRKKTVTGRVLHDPVKDKLRPIFPLDLSKCRSIDELVRAMGDTAFTGRQIGDAADVLEAMARTSSSTVRHLDKSSGNIGRSLSFTGSWSTLPVTVFSRCFAIASPRLN